MAETAKEIEIRELEKRMEKEINEVKRRAHEDVMHLDDSFKTFKEVLKKVYEEKKGLEKDRDFLVERHKELLRQIPVQKDRLERKISEKIGVVQQKIKENAELVAAAAREDLAEEKSDDKEDTPIDELFGLVMKSGKINVSDAAKKFNVHEARIEEWGKILEDHGLIEMHYPTIGKPELRKKTQQ